MSVNVNTLYLTTSLVEARATLAALVREHDDVEFKVGISYEPIRRVIGVSPTFMDGGGPKLHGKMNRDYRWVTALFYLFETECYEHCQDAERELIGLLRSLVPKDRIRNRVGGGGGRRTSRARYFVYLARS